MANPEHVKILKEGVGVWNRWREENPTVIPEFDSEDLQDLQLERANLAGAKMHSSNLQNTVLYDADLSDADLLGADLQLSKLCRANLKGASLHGAELLRADLRRANLQGATIMDVTAFWADFSYANLEGAHLSGAMLAEANLGHTNLREADLRGANLVRTNLTGADLSGALIYGISAWDVLTEGTKQNDLVVTQWGQSKITVDNLEVAQFIYLLLYNQKIRQVVDAITSKVVLILGRFSPDRKTVLDAIRGEVRRRDYLPVMFDFEKPKSRTTAETVATLAGLARFIIADLTDAKSVLQELQAVVPQHPSVPVQPLLLSSQNEPGMFDFFERFPWVRPVFAYESREHLLGSIGDIVEAEKVRVVG